jgi:hypothetical protein
MKAARLARDLPGTDEFIERCERVRTWNYMVRAAAHSRLPAPLNSAGTAVFGRAQVWFDKPRARVHLLGEAELGDLPVIETWLAEHELQPQFEVLPIVPCRPVAAALGERGYRLVSWQPTLYRELTAPVEGLAVEGVEVREVRRDDPEFCATFVGGYEIPEPELEAARQVIAARWEAEGARCFLALIAGKPVSAATLVVFDGIARLANCATLPWARSSGAQTALIRERLRHAAAAGIALAVSDARQGGGSLRNLSRAGFAICAHVAQWQRV